LSAGHRRGPRPRPAIRPAAGRSRLLPRRLALNYVGSVPASDCPDLLALPAAVRSIVDPDRFGKSS